MEIGESKVMSDVALRLSQELLRLSADDRAALIYFLRESLDDEVDEGYHEAWEAELSRRMEEIHSGTEIGRPAKEVFDELRRKYS